MRCLSMRSLSARLGCGRVCVVGCVSGPGRGGSLLCRGWGVLRDRGHRLGGLAMLLARCGLWGLWRLLRLLGLLVDGRGVGIDGGRFTLGCGGFGFPAPHLASTGQRMIARGSGSVCRPTGGVTELLAGGVRWSLPSLSRPDSGSRGRIHARFVTRGGTIHHFCSVTVTALSGAVEDDRRGYPYALYPMRIIVRGALGPLSG